MNKGLTEREYNVLELLAQGKNNDEIADILSIGDCTVKAHISSILKKLHVKNRTQAAVIAIKGHFFKDSE